MTDWEIRTGHALELLRAMPERSVQCCVTSPPYWGLRDYKSEPIVWGGDDNCAHDWSDGVVVAPGGICGACGAWRGALGLEPTPEMFVDHLVLVFREVRRVLRDDGVLVVNIGDSYAAAGKTGRSDHGVADQTVRLAGNSRGAENVGYARGRKAPNGMKPKDVVGIPWMLAFALRDDGWYLRNEIIWAKGVSFAETGYAGSVMPESVTDRLTKSHEQVFLLAKSADYFWDAEAIKEQGVFPAGTRGQASTARALEFGVNSRPPEPAVYSGTRNARTVWAINPEPFDGEFCTACRTFFDGRTKRQIKVVQRGIPGKYSRAGDEGHRSNRFGDGLSPEDVDPIVQPDLRICPCGRSDAWLSHFATFPSRLVDKVIRAATSAKGCCAECGAPYERVEERRSLADPSRVTVVPSARRMAYDERGTPISGQQNPWRGDEFVDQRANSAPGVDTATRVTVGWAPTCGCGVNQLAPCVVLDPFCGSGTTVFAALRLNRRAIGLELNPDYADMARARVVDDAPLFNMEWAE